MMVMVVISCGTGCSFDYKYLKKIVFLVVVFVVLVVVVV